MEMDPIHRFEMTTVCLTSEMTLRKLAVFFKASIRFTQNDLVRCLYELVEPLSQCFLPVANASAVQPVVIFADLSNTFGILDAGPIFIQRPQSNQKEYYSGNTKRTVLKYRQW
jgi:hypothetical protein